MNPEEMWARWNASPLAFESNPASYSAMAALAHDAIEALDAAQTHTRELDDALQAACAERDAAQARVKELEAQLETSAQPVWYTGSPPFPQDQEWFIALTKYGDKVVLRALPEDYAYDYTTADHTYMKRENVIRWRQFPDCEYLPPALTGDER